jgi:dTDP-glucose 4,6-dehydratase
LVADLIHARQRLNLDLRIVLVTRRDLIPELGEIEVMKTDVQTMSGIGAVDFIIHAAASSSAQKGTIEADPDHLALTIEQGTQSVIEAASRETRVLFLSSGAVYGTQFAPAREDTPPNLDHSHPDTAYALGKLAAEEALSRATLAGDLSAVVTRLFSFVGPRIPLQGHFAAGNFLGDLVAGRTIKVRGDGTPVRSYLYTGDLPAWCWAALVRGAPGRIFNVGSDEAVSIASLAEYVAAVGSPQPRVDVLGAPSGTPPPWYVPDIARARTELGVSVRTSLSDALAKTARWLRDHVGLDDSAQPHQQLAE